VTATGEERVVPFRSILVPTDFSEKAHVALRYGRVLAARFSSTLHVLHVTDVVNAAGVAFWGISESKLRADLKRAVRPQFEALLPELDGLKISLATRSGCPLVEIVHYARERNVDLIVMGTDGRRRFAHMLSGCVVEKVVRNAPCPVLAVRSPCP
jgi:nucleotide-binding universal stress UspA family protein